MALARIGRAKGVAALLRIEAPLRFGGLSLRQRCLCLRLCSLRRRLRLGICLNGGGKVQLDVGVDVVRGQFRLLLVLTWAQYHTLLANGIEAWSGFEVQEKLGNYGLNYKVVSGLAQEEAAALERIIALLDLGLADQRQISRRIVEAKQINTVGGVVLAEDLSWEQVARLKARALDLPVDVAVPQVVDRAASTAHDERARAKHRTDRQVRRRAWRCRQGHTPQAGP